MQKHEIVMKRLVLDIFNNKLRDGDKLPTERQLSVELGVDRTSLRIALKQLEAMQVLDIRQGDGIYVKDYRKFAGVDFLRMLLFQQEDNGDEFFLGEYLIQEIWAFWIEFMPLMIRMSMARMAPMDMKQFIDIFDQELEHLDDREKIVELEVLTQELIAEKTGNLLILLISNSTRQMRLKIVRLFIAAMDRAAIKAHVEFKRALVRGYVTGAISDRNLLGEEHRKLLQRHWEKIKGQWGISAEEREIVHRVLSADAGTKAAS